MSEELAEIRDFLASCPPFDLLDSAVLNDLPRHFVVRYLRRGSPFPPAGDPCLWLVRQGALELRSDAGVLLRRFGEGDVHDAQCLPESPEQGLIGHAVEDSLLYALPRGALEALWQTHPDLRQAAVARLGERLRKASVSEQNGSPIQRGLTGMALAELIVRPPVQAAPNISIREAAALMTQAGVSALLVVDAGQLTGILTDRDLRSRCLASGLADSLPVARIMTTNPYTLPPDAPAFEALLAMSRHGIHHLPVMRGGQLLGLVSSTDLLRAQGVSTIHLADRIHRAADLGEIARCATELPELWLGLAGRGETAAALGHVASCIGDALARRLLVLAESRLGPPPVSYAWIAFGSQGRQELTVQSDQDNALVLADDYDAARHGDYFSQLADSVCDGLVACGFAYCPGQMMAANRRWRLTLTGWRMEFADWMHHADPQKARLASNLFDLRLVSGDPALCLPLRELISREAGTQESFLAHLVANACAAPPPLGLFRQFVVASSGEHEGRLDLKRHGILPIVDLARIHSLATGSGEIGTVGRLQAAAGSSWLSREGAETLLAALDFLLALRVKLHSNQIRSGLAVDNFIAPDSLSAWERRHLRDAFDAIASAQQVLRLIFPELIIP